MNAKSRVFSCSRLLLNQFFRDSIKTQHKLFREIPISSSVSQFPSPKFNFLWKAHYSTVSDRVVHELLAEVEKEKQRERERRKRAGLDTKDIDAEEEEDYMGVGPLIEKLEKEKSKNDPDLMKYEEPSDSDSDEDDERFSADALKKRRDEFERKFKRHEELLRGFTEAGIVRFS